MQYPVTYNANAGLLAKPSSITIDAKTLKKWTKNRTEIGFTPSGGHKILKEFDKYVPSGRGSISESITGTPRLRRPNAANANDYRRAAFRMPITAKPTRKTATKRKPATKVKTPKSTSIAIRRGGEDYVGTPEALRKLFGI